MNSKLTMAITLCVLIALCVWEFGYAFYLVWRDERDAKKKQKKNLNGESRN